MEAVRVQKKTKQAYPMRKYPIDTLGGGYIHTSFANYQNSLNSYNSDLMSSKISIKVKILEVMKRNSIRKENEIIRELEMIDPGYAAVLKNKFDKSLEILDNQLLNVLENLDSALDPNELMIKTSSSQNKTGTMFTNRNLRDISKTIQNSIKNILMELSNVDTKTAERIKKINNLIKEESAGFQKTAKLYKAGKIDLIEEEALNSIKTMATNLIEKERIILSQDILNEIQRDLSNGRINTSYSKQKEIPLGAIKINRVVAKEDVKENFIAMMKTIQESSEFKSRFFDYDIFKYIYGNTGRFQTKKTNFGSKVQKELDKIYGSVMSEMLLPFTSSFNSKEQYFFFTGQKTVRRSELIEELIQEELLFRPDFIFKNKIDKGTLKQIDNAKKSASGKKIYGSDESFYAPRKLKQAQFFNSLSADYASLFEIDLQER